MIVLKYYYNLKTFFEEIAKEYASNVALRFSNVCFTYAELNDKANTLAAYLLTQGLKQGDLVAIASTKCFEDYALMIACLKLGVAYTNIDIDNPSSRNKDIFTFCQPKIIFGKNNLPTIQETCSEMNLNYCLYTSISEINTSNPNSDFDGDTVAYVMFTSGSTGIPKGAAITQQNLIHFIHWATSRHEIQSRDNFANISPMYFDNSVFDFYTALFSGASLTPISKALLNKPLDLVDYITEKKCTIWFSVPSMLIYLTTMRVLSKDKLNSIRLFTFGGEGYPKTELKKLYVLYSDHAKFVNVYGPTECTCICSSYDISEADLEDLSELPSLGIINPNFAYVILDDGMKPNKEGELYLLGPNVGLGYYNDEKRTKDAFSFFSDDKHYKKRAYKTGDLVKEQDGLLYFKGRADNQIKHMGYRIELEEIEIALNSLSSVKQSAVLYIRNNTAFGKIHACLILEDSDVDLSLIKEELSFKLPSYMMPNVYQILDSFPKNANGKIDKNALKESQKQVML